MEIKNLKIVVFENAYQNFTDPFTAEIFKKTLLLKRLGYEGFYPYGYLPVDTTDLVGAHHLICEETSTGHLRPLAGFKSITYQQCTQFNLKFPALALLESEGEHVENHLSVTREIIKNAALELKTISFGSAWTIDPHIRNDREASSLLKDIARAMLYFYQTENKIDEEMCVGIPQAKTDVYFSELGYDPIKKDQTPLPEITLNLNGKKIILLHRKKFTEKAILAGEKHKELWLNKIYIQDYQENKYKEVA